MYHPFFEHCICKINVTSSIFRRGGEPARMFIEQYKEALDNVWVDKSRLKNMNLSPLEERLINSTKISYMVGKNTRLVPIIFPNDTLDALQVLANPSIRKRSGVSSSNPYLFASTRQSPFHLSGWHCFNTICKTLKLQEPTNLTFTQNRHFVSTLYSLMELPKEERSHFYEHMGHSELMNKQRYQCPPALKELTAVGKALHAIDEG